ncbi:metallohydrolase [Paraperlucidibaca sp.]|uniref:metallohydrolase n=1 Tax=Paraperlucidibaca sp. TaxID=2708021 RepID=UPI0030F399E2
MAAKIEFFPVDNGDMTLVTLESGRTILIDVNIRQRADDDKDNDAVDVASLLRARLQRDTNNRLYVDAFLLSHPDEDHCRGLTRHFHLGKAGEWSAKDDKILIREMWSSPIVFRRAKDIQGAVCADAAAWWVEARRRVKTFVAAANKAGIADGERIQVLGEDRDGKTDDLTDILVKSGSDITKIGGKVDGTFRGRLLSPQLVSKEDAEKLTGKNQASVVTRFNIRGGGNDDACLFLTGGDAEVESWERIWSRTKHQISSLQYNLLQAPHHCSWRSLSEDSWSDLGEHAVASSEARSALGQALAGAYIVSSSKEIIDDDDDPPCIRAKREYESIVKGVSGSFLCTADECEDDVLLFEITADGPKPGKKGSGSSGEKLRASVTSEPRMADKQGGGRYA